MATPVTEPAPLPPPPPAPPVSVAAEANKSLAAVKTGKDLLRPLRMARKFVEGTLVEGLNGMATYGRKGLMVGIGIGIIAAIAASALWPLFGLALTGFALGAGGGTLKGVLTGGMHAVGRDYRAHKYAEDLVQRKSMQDKAPANTYDYRAAYREQQLDQSFRNQQLQTRNNENTRDFNTYWQDREGDRRHRLPQETGLGY